MKKNNTGFTYIELILYVAILALMTSTLVSFALTIIAGSAKNATDGEVSGNARFISEKIKYEIRNASGVNSVSSSSISLSTFDSPSNPTVISISGGNITIQEGVGASVRLNSTNTILTNASFTNYTSGDNKTKHIGFSFTVNDNFTSDRQEYERSIPVEGSAEVRSN